MTEEIHAPPRLREPGLLKYRSWRKGLGETIFFPESVCPAWLFPHLALGASLLNLVSRAGLWTLHIWVLICFCSLLAVWPWTNYFTSLSLGVLCKMEKTVISTHKVVELDKLIHSKRKCLLSACYITRHHAGSQRHKTTFDRLEWGEEQFIGDNKQGNQLIKK